MKIALLALLAVAAGIITLASEGDLGVSRTGGDHADIVTYRAQIEQMRAGDGAYEAAADALTRYGYPTASPFNWRLPLSLLLIAKLPGPRTGQVLLVLLSVCLIGLGSAFVSARAGPGAGGAAALLLTSPVLFSLIGDIHVQPALWAGVLLGLSAAAHGLGYRRLAVIPGILAPLIREFAIVWVLACLVFAVRERRRRETAWWAGGLALFAVGLASHAILVSVHQVPSPLAQAESWFQWGGLPFVLSTFRMNAYLLLLPDWATSLFFVVALAGVLGWRDPTGRRIAWTVVGFVAAFTVIGLPYNQYWGLVFGPLACLGAAHGPAAVRDMWRSARGGAARRSESGVHAPA